MKKYLLAAALAAGVSSSAAAVETWQGDLFITTATAACANNNWVVNDFLRTVFRPAGLEDNGTSSHLALFTGRTGQRYSVSGNFSGNGNYSAVGIFGSGGSATWNSTFSIATVKPAAPTVDTQTVFVRVRFANFANVAGCTVTLQGSLGNRPNF